MNNRSKKGLDFLNFFLADVRDGVGPYLAVFLAASQNWNASDIGIVMGAMGIATGVAQIPAGKWMDVTKNKRLVLSIACAIIGIACPLMVLTPSFTVILLCQIAIGASAAFVLPGIASMTLGIVGYKGYAHRQGRNEVFNHAGNIVAALLAGIIGHFIAIELIFWIVGLWSFLSIGSIYIIRNKDIDVVKARGAVIIGNEVKIVDYKKVLTNKLVVIFAGVIVLFHFGNAAMLPLVGQELSANHLGEGASLWMSACIILAQLVMLPVASFAGKYADVWGRKPIFLIGLVALPIRGILYTFSDAPAYLLAVQSLDGIGAGIFGVIWVLVAADITRGTGHYNLVLGVLNAAHMVGFFLSQTTSGFVVDYFDSFSAGFIYLSIIACLALLLFAFKMPETLNIHKRVAAVKEESF